MQSHRVFFSFWTRSSADCNCPQGKCCCSEGPPKANMERIVMAMGRGELHRGPGPNAPGYGEGSSLRLVPEQSCWGPSECPCLRRCPLAFRDGVGHPHILTPCSAIFCSLSLWETLQEPTRPQLPLCPLPSGRGGRRGQGRLPATHPCFPEVGGAEM